MQTKVVRDYMIPLEEYAQVGLSSSVLDVVNALREKKGDTGQHKHTTVLVFDDQGEMVARLTLLDIMAGMEPKYREIAEMDLDRFGYSRDFLQTMVKDYNLWENSLKDVCRSIPETRIESIITKNDKSEFIQSDATLDVAIHQMIMTRFHSLLCVENEKVVGILRSIDLFNVFLENIESCSS